MRDVVRSTVSRRPGFLSPPNNSVIKGAGGRGGGPPAYDVESEWEGGREGGRTTRGGDNINNYYARLPPLGVS